MEKELLEVIEDKIKLVTTNEERSSPKLSSYYRGQKEALNWIKKIFGTSQYILVRKEGKGETRSVDLTNATVVDNYFDQASPEFNPYPMTREQIIDVKENGSRYTYDSKNKIWIKCHE